MSGPEERGGTEGSGFHHSGRKAEAKLNVCKTKLLKEKDPVRFQLYHNLEKTKLWRQSKDQWLPGVGGKECIGVAQGFAGQ